MISGNKIMQMRYIGLHLNMCEGNQTRIEGECMIEYGDG